MAGKAIVKKIRDYVIFLRGHDVPVETAYLYGSYARGDEQADSDIDVMLVSEAFDDYSVKEKGRIWNITSKFDYRIEPYIVGKKRFLTDDVSPIILIVKQEGIPIN